MTAIDTSTAAVTALMDGVTEGPWEASSGHVQSNGQLYWQVEDKHDAIVNNQFCWAQGDHGANASFIAASRQLVPALLAERDALEAEVERLRAREAELAASLGALRAALSEIANAKLSALRQPPHSARNPPWEDADPVVDAEEAWAMQQTARDALKEMESGK